MSLLMENRDYVRRGDTVTTVSGGESVVNEVLFRLTARRGSFPLMPGLGSRLYLLSREKPADRPVLARRYAEEALAELSDLTVRKTHVTRSGDRLWVEVELEWRGELLTVDCEV